MANKMKSWWKMATEAGRWIFLGREFQNIGPMTRTVLSQVAIHLISGPPNMAIVVQCVIYFFLKVAKWDDLCMSSRIIFQRIKWILKRHVPLQQQQLYVCVCIWVLERLIQQWLVGQIKLSVILSLCRSWFMKGTLIYWQRIVSLKC